jgi:hypothetical protein
VTAGRTSVPAVTAARSSTPTVAHGEVDKATRYPGTDLYPSLFLYPSAGWEGAAVAYTRQTWTNGQAGATPLSADRLAHIEDGIFAAVQHVNIKSYGAACDGSTDDSSAWASAVAALGSSPGVLYCPGVSVCAPDVIVLDSGQWLAGDGHERSMVTQKAGTSGTALVASKSFGSLTGTDTISTPYNFGVRDITINGAKATTSGSTKGIAFYGYGYAVVNARVRNTRGMGYWTEWALQSTSPGNDSMEAAISNFKAVGCLGGGISHQGPHDAQFNNIIVAQCGNGAGTYAIDMPVDGRANGSTWEQVHVWGGNFDYGFRIASSGIHLDGCQVEGAITAQLRYEASLNSFAACKLFSGGVNQSALGISIANGVGSIRGTAKIENLTGGAVSFGSGAGSGDHSLDLHCSYYGGVSAPGSVIVGSVDSNTWLDLLVHDGTGSATSETQQVVPGIVKPRHVVAGGSAPAASAGAAAGSSPTGISVAGGDLGGTVNITTGTGPSTGSLVTVTFAQAFAASPRIVVTPSNSASAVLQPYIAARSTTSFTIGVATAPSASAGLGFHYTVIG